MLLGTVLKGFPIAYSLARTCNMMYNFIPLIAHRPLHIQHHVESYFPSLDWETYFKENSSSYRNILIIDDVVNSGFTKQRLESIIFPMISKGINLYFCALILNKRYLNNPHFIDPLDTFVFQVNAKAVECDWGTITVPLINLKINDALTRCREYFNKFWSYEKRLITIIY